MRKKPEIEAWLDRSIFPFWPHFTRYHLILTLILIIAVLSRFIMLGERVMSHDEVNHVVPAYTYYTGGGYRYDPVTHGPLQFHLIALSYTLFGDSDFSARIPDALFGVAIVTFALFAFRKYLGKVGSLVAGFLFTISPFISFYSRYTRNEIYIAFWGMALIWGVLHYLEYGRKRTMFFITLITALHFTDKATSYIFTAELLIFLALVFVTRILSKPWQSKRLKTIFISIVASILIIGIVTFGIGYNALSNAPSSEGDEGVGVMISELPVATRLLIGGLAVGLLAGLILAAFFLIKGIGWHGVRDERSFDLLLMQGTIVLPLLAALPMDILGFNPLDYSSRGILTSLLFILPLLIFAVLIGLWWNWKAWLINIGIFWGTFIIFYTSLFTQGSGFAAGLMGALGYWIAQQGVTRGTQPLYYYALVQIPMYEFLPAFGTLLAGLMSLPILAKHLQSNRKQIENQTDSEIQTSTMDASLNLDDIENEEQDEGLDHPEDILEISPLKSVDNEGDERQPPVLALLLYWSVMSLFAFSFAGERMPWLTTHIAMPMILTSGWSFGRLLESFNWIHFRKHRGWLMILLGGLFFLTTFRTFAVLLGPNPPFQGNELSQLEATSTFLLALLVMVATAVGLYLLLEKWPLKQIGKLALILFIGILGVITIRTSFRANFILYDTAKEFLVYAHAARDPKDVLSQVEEISQRLTGGKDIKVAYDNDLLYPYWWYFRDYPNKIWYADNPTRDLQDAPIILVGSGNYSSIEPVVGDDYLQFDFHRLWWPSQAYYNLTFQRAWNALSNPDMRSALWEIWFNRNYQPYAQLANVSTLTLENWQPSDSFRMYLRKDVVSQIWEYGAAPVLLEPTVDPYEADTIDLQADLILQSSESYQFNTPRDLDVAPDGTLYVTDASNHRILHLSAEGALLHAWGEYGATDYNTNVAAPPGYFNDPWGVAVGPDGSVYVADTWNNRVQKFTPEGDFLTMWGQFGAAESPYHFWGPRGIAVDDQGRVYVTDTGNKRVVIFDSEGNDLADFGGAGFGVGEFDEPVGIDVDDQGRVYIGDTWNRRIQVMLPQGESLHFPSNITWDIDAWTSESLENKPFLAADSDYNTFVADPVMGRVLAFDITGTFKFAWGSFGTGPAEIGIVSGIAIDEQNRVWVSDARNNRLMRFTLPEFSAEQPLEFNEEDPIEELENEIPVDNGLE